MVDDGERFHYLGDAERTALLREQAALLTHETRSTQDGRRLRVFTAGRAGGPVALLVNPLGVSCLFLLNIIRALAPHYRVITWESRGLPEYYPDGVARREEWLPETHYRDLETVLGEGPQGRAEVVIAYCSGSFLALYAAARGSVRGLQRLCLISPPLELGATGEKTLYQKAFSPLLPRIARSGPALAGLVRGIILQGASRAQPGIDGELRFLNDMPFTSDERTYRYACLHAPWRELVWSELLPSVRIPTKICHGLQDAMVHPDTVKQLAAALPDARLALYPDQGHFAVYQCPELIDEVVSFAREGREQSPESLDRGSHGLTS